MPLRAASALSQTPFIPQQLRATPSSCSASSSSTPPQSPHAHAPSLSPSLSIHTRTHAVIHSRNAFISEGSLTQSLHHQIHVQNSFWEVEMAASMGRLVVLVLFMAVMSSVAMAQSKAPPATFTLGDSLVDVGNNNYFFTLAVANHKPYGIDRPDKVATGRFCNGRIIPDLISDYLGQPYALPVLAPDAKGANLLHGINYASAGAGILEDTGSIFIGRLTMPQQFGYFKKTKEQLVELLGQAGMEELVANAIYSISVGGNDYVNNYLAATTSTKSKYNPAQYQDLLIRTFEGQLRTAYGLGMRKFIISNMGPIGCAPSMLNSKSQAGECVQDANNLAAGFNAALQPLTESLQAQLPGSVFLVTNSFRVVKNIVDNPLQYGFTEPVHTACCGVGKYNGIDGGCRTISNLCTDRTKSVFWDAFHPTETVNEITSQLFLTGGLDVITPMNVKQLLAM